MASETAGRESAPARGARGPDPRTLLSEDAAELLGTRPPVGARRTLLAIVLAVGGALAWGALGRIETRVVARGVLAVEGDVSVVRAEAAGLLRVVRIHEGEHVATGTPLLDIDERTVIAPREGVVVKVTRAAGQRVAVDETLVVVVGRAAKTLAQVRVPAAEAARLAPGQKARVRIGTAPASVVVSGSLVRVGIPVADAELGAASFAVVTLDEPMPFTAVPGVPIEAEIVTGDVSPLEWVLGRRP